MLHFSEQPGAHERHLRRRLGNPLFPAFLQGHGDAEIEARLEASQHRDRQEAEAFESELHQLLQEAIALKPQEESEVILALKARLDRAYVQATSLGGERQAQRAALSQLTDVVMRAVRSNTEGDAVALMELEQEAVARATNYRLLEQPLVADLMRPDSPIDREELAAVLLGESPAALEAALWLFGPEELEALCGEATAHLQRLDPSRQLPAAWANLETLTAAREQPPEVN